MVLLMRSRLFWRRSAAAAGIYASVALGFFGTVIAAHAFSTRVLGLYAIVIAATGFFQTLLDLTIEEALVKYGFRFQERADWGRLRRLFGRALQVKLAGGILAGICLLALAPASGALFGDPRLETPMLIAAALPLVQSPENVGGVALILRGRYDIRAFFLFFSMALRLGSDRDRDSLRADGDDRGDGRRAGVRHDRCPCRGLGCVPAESAGSRDFDRRRASRDRSLRDAVQRCDGRRRAQEHA